MTTSTVSNNPDPLYEEDYTDDEFIEVLTSIQCVPALKHEDIG
jgi:hypothetical protein